jgi:hypothetical protein
MPGAILFTSMPTRIQLAILVLLAIHWSCKKSADHAPLYSDVTITAGVNFENKLTFSDTLNPYTYRNFYNGAGVAIGDINNDGLLDIYFSGNQVDSKLYLNKGNFHFEDVTEKAGVACSGSWSTGVTFADVNSDGLLDLYVCKSGSPHSPNRHNQLFINNGNLTFSDRAEEYGLAVVGLSVQAAFFDYDRDGDLDCYLLTNSFKPVGNYDIVKDQREIEDADKGGNKFFLNTGNRFIDYSKEANIYNSNIGFGLGITLGDFNHDDWIDIYVSNDFFERDYLYVNNQKGGYKEQLTDYFQSISLGSMGADYADLDNDGLKELFVTEMLPDSVSRRKSKAIFENWNRYQLNVTAGYHHQFSRNVLQKEVGKEHFVEIGRLAGVAASEWSWGALLFDMDNDGKRDIFIANGIYKDLLDRDYLTYTGAEENIRTIIKEEKNAIVKLINQMPSSQFQNYSFKNQGNLHFENVANHWGFSAPHYSSGSAYGDLDNDGDLDLVISNINEKAIVYRNNTDSSAFKSITLVLRSTGINTFAVGTEVKAYVGDTILIADNFVTRGYQSCVQPNITIGLGKNVSKLDSLVVKWPDGRQSSLFDVRVNKKLVLDDSKALSKKTFSPPEKQISFELTMVQKRYFKHQSSELIDFNRDRLLPMMLSDETPSLLKGDIDQDGLPEIYIGGGKDQVGMFLTFKNKDINAREAKSFASYRLSEETKGALVDVDGDGDLDFYMACGGRFFPKSSSALTDKIFLNSSKGEFTESPYPLPFTDFVSTSVVKPIDFDNDSDMDLFIGERFEPFSYGLGGRGFLFENDGKGAYKDVTDQYAPSLKNRGMVTDAEVQDINNDGWKDLILVGDWMPIVVLKNDRGKFLDGSAELGLDKTVGWWHTIKSGDFNQDGKPDFVVGNHGLNSFFKVGDRMYVGDFDKNGSIEQIFCTKMAGNYYPILDKDELTAQLPSLKKDLLYYKEYSKKSIDQIWPATVLAEAKVLEVEKLASVAVISSTIGYKMIDLPLEAQFSPIYGILVHDFDNDGIEDVIAGGNQYGVKPQFGRYDASAGWFFKGSLNNGKFNFLKGVDLNIKGQVRDIQYVEVNGLKYVLFAKYDDELEIYKISN